MKIEDRWKGKHRWSNLLMTLGGGGVGCSEKMGKRANLVFEIKEGPVCMEGKDGQAP